MKSLTSSKFGQIQPRTAGLDAHERLKKIAWTYNGENDVSYVLILAGNEGMH